MDQKKTGAFLQSLRKERELTQEELAEKFSVTSRTVSRWETGENMPDISLLTDIADFYEVDVREIIEGERKSEMMDEELKDVADKMADYADMEKSRLCKWVQIIGFIGVVLAAFSIILQGIRYESGSGDGIAIVATFVALIAMAITTLYVNGILSKLIKKKAFNYFIKFSVFALVIVSLKYVLGILFVITYVLHGIYAPLGKVEGADKYDKKMIVEKYSSDLNSKLLLFPDSLEGAVDADYHQGLKEGIFDTDGYIFLEVKYSDEDYETEKKRISETSNEVDYDLGDHSTVTKEVKYDDETYNYPAYVANDGYSYAYEYTLMDEENDTIIYVALSYPEFYKMSKYKDYLKKDRSEYNIEDSTVQFTIYY